MKKVLVLLIFILIILPQVSFGLLFDRRQVPPTEFSYFLYPIAGSIPGLQTFYGLGFTLANIADSASDVTFVSLSGEAKYIDDGDFHINLLTLLDVPLFSEHLSISGVYSHVTNGTMQETARGMSSDPDETHYLLAKKVLLTGGSLSLNFFDYQLEFYHGFLSGDIDPYGVQAGENRLLDEGDDININRNAYGTQTGIYIDDTDNRRDPRLGYRIQLEGYTVPRTSNESASYKQLDKNLTVYIPVMPDRAGVVVLNYFMGDSEVIDEGTVDRNKYTCPPTATANCQEELDRIYERQTLNAEYGRATALGGTNRLRGYPNNRFVDSYTLFRGIEFRWYINQTNINFDYIIEKGSYFGSQLAFFYEEGSVAREAGDFNVFKNSKGFGYRALLGTTVVRVDLGFSDEGRQTTVFIGYPF